MKTILATLFFAISLAASNASSQVQIAPDPIAYTSFQHNLWNDLWQDDFEDGTDFLLATGSLTPQSISLHRMEFHQDDAFLDGSLDAATLSERTIYDMSWHENVSTPFSAIADDESLVQGTITILTSAFAGKVSSGFSYQPYIYGLTKSVHIVFDEGTGDFNAEYHFFMPVGRGVLLQDAQDAAQALSDEILPPPGLLADQNDNCLGIYDAWRQLAFQDYQDDIDDCGFIGGMVGGATAGGAVGGTVGSIIGVFTGPGVIVVGGGTAIVCGIIGGIGGGIYGMTDCISDAKKGYRQQYNRHLACLLACRSTGTWSCNY